MKTVDNTITIDLDLKQMEEMIDEELAEDVVAIELAGLRGKLRKLAVRKELQALSGKNRNALSSQLHHHRTRRP